MSEMHFGGRMRVNANPVPLRQNSLSDLAGGLAAYGQSNITSINPIYRNEVYAPLTLQYVALTYMYKTHGVLQTAIDQPVLDAFRGGLDLQSKQLDPEQVRALADKLEDDGVYDGLVDLFRWARLFGGAAILINTDDDDSAKPLKIKSAKRVRFIVVARWEIQSMSRFSESYDFYGQRFHHTRVQTISGKEAPYLIKRQLQGWGMSEFERMVLAFNLNAETDNVTYDLLREAKLDVFSMEGFNDLLASANGTEIALQRLQAMNQIKNYNNATVLDAKDKFDQKQITFSGLAEVMKQNMTRMAAVTRIPMTKLYGISAAGFNSGEDDIENYNTVVESEVRGPARRVIRKILSLMCQVVYGAELDIDFRYHPLRLLGAVEEETVKSSKHARFRADWQARAITTEEYGQILEKENLVPIPLEATQGNLEEMAGETEDDQDDDAPDDDKGEKKD